MSAQRSTAPASEIDVPFLDLVQQHTALADELARAFREALHNSVFVGGGELAAFEREFAAFLGAPDSVGVSSGTDALRFAYMALGLRAGDEVVTVPNTFIATTEAVSQAGGRTRFVDVLDDTLTMDPRAVEAAIGPRTVGLVPVHLFGQPADMDPLLDIARRHRLWVVEDAAQAHGAMYKGRAVGTLGALGAFSFYPGKNLGACGEAGAVVGGTESDRDRLAVIRRLRDHGQSRKYYHDSEGYNGRLDAIQAAFLRIKLRHLREWNDARRHVATRYQEALADVRGIRLPTEADYCRHVYHLYVIRAERRDALQVHLASNGIRTGLHYPVPLHLQEAYRDLGIRRGAFPVAEAAADSILSLPMFPELTDEQIWRVAEAIRTFYRQ